MSTRIRRPLLWVGALMWLLVVPAGIAAWQAVRSANPPLPTFGPAPDLAMIDQHGDPFVLADLVGHVTVVDFIFTRCPDVCPLMTTKMAWLQRELPAEPRGGLPITFASVSVDPEYDTPERLRAYGDRYGVDHSRWSLLTGTRAESEAVAEGFRQALEWNGTGSEGGVPDIRHSQKFILVDPYGMVRGFYDSDAEGLERLASDALDVAREEAAVATMVTLAPLPG